MNKSKREFLKVSTETSFPDFSKPTSRTDSSVNWQSETFSSSLFANLTASAFDRLGGKKLASEPAGGNPTRAASTEAGLNYAHVQAVARELVPPFEVLSRPRRSATFAALQEWEGYVVSVTETHLIANLVDLTGAAARADEEAEIPLAELNEGDILKLKPGRVFRWAIGYQRLPAGTKMRVSQIVFRELPQWTVRELQEARSEASKMADFLNSEMQRQEANGTPDGQ
jgi:hypothetical protein